MLDCCVVVFVTFAFFAKISFFFLFFLSFLSFGSVRGAVSYHFSRSGVRGREQQNQQSE